MLGVVDPNLVVVGYALGGLALLAFYRFIVWIRDAPIKPDPWDATVQSQLEDAPETCPNCSTPQTTHAWFCPHCGRAVGPYNNLMPYLQIFSEGEVLRNSGCNHFRKRPLVVIGYCLLGLTFLPAFLLPVYWFSLLRNWLQSDAPKATLPD